VSAIARRATAEAIQGQEGSLDCFASLRNDDISGENAGRIPLSGTLRMASSFARAANRPAKPGDDHIN
jgi:hypothetical protein